MPKWDQKRIKIFSVLGRNNESCEAMPIAWGIVSFKLQNRSWYSSLCFSLILRGFYWDILNQSLFKEKSIIREFAELQEQTSLEQQNPDKRFFFGFLMIVWCLYFVFKSTFYLWINWNTSLEEGLLIRMIFGKLSFWIMMFVSIGLPRQIWKLLEKMRLFPYQRAKQTLGEI